MSNPSKQAIQDPTILTSGSFPKQASEPTEAPVPSSQTPMLDELLGDPDAPVAETIQLPSGRLVQAHSSPEQNERLTIRNSSGVVELQIELTETGPRLRFESADVELASSGTVSVDCERFEVRAEQSIVHKTRGYYAQAVGGDTVLYAKGQLHTKAESTIIETTRGDTVITANDDVKLEGERIKLNC